MEIVSGNQESNANAMAENRLGAGAQPAVPGRDGSVLVGEWRRGDHLFDLYDLGSAQLTSLENQYGGSPGCASGYGTLMR